MSMENHADMFSGPVCPKCGVRVHLTTPFCLNCGEKLLSSLRIQTIRTLKTRKGNTPKFGHADEYKATCFDEVVPGDTVYLKDPASRGIYGDLPDRLVALYVDYELPSVLDAQLFTWEFAGTEGPEKPIVVFNRWDIEKVVPILGNRPFEVPGKAEGDDDE